MASAFLLVWGEFVDEEVDGVDIGVAVEEEAIGTQAVTAGAPDLLVIAFQVFGQVVMENEADIGFINAHTESDGGDDDGDVVTDKLLLVETAVGVVEAGVVGEGVPAVALELLGELVDLAAGGAVDNAGLLLVVVEEGEGLFKATRFGGDGEEKVFTIEAGDKFISIGDGKALFNVGADLFGGGGGDGEADGVGELLADGG